MMISFTLIIGLSGFPLHIPPLWASREEIAVLAEHFDQPNHQVSKEAVDYMLSLDFPQNIRELEKLIPMQRNTMPQELSFLLPIFKICWNGIAGNESVVR
jgi:transcriptional regulator with GAF, ATPase, and Fis domain